MQFQSKLQKENGGTAEKLSVLEFTNTTILDGICLAATPDWCRRLHCARTLNVLTLTAASCREPQDLGND